ncbi:hypothetical protein [Dokdonella immobilis]|uniref:Uncharacterized protein n=1 Tax=Dokdonella immobilis TaxID=578942 RepID=A0A1I4WNM2_9GAMM|nr:hypothetical protein [Dokdonella immobilis]SFN14740.1 hypothetical protein SAMN05216289_105161 [Dokdonella immobilis]
MNRTIHTRLMLALAIAAIVGSLGLAGTSSRELTSPAATVATARPAEVIPTLPTVMVRASVEIPTLPVVVVRADAPAQAEPAREFLVASTSASVPALGMPALPHVRLDMPYYSFGKLLPRAIKE